MGGDHGPAVTLAACRRFLSAHPQARLILVGTHSAISDFSHPRAENVYATEVVAMDDPLEVALRKKKDSSMRVAVEQVKAGLAHAAVSAGNTGALMAISRYVLKTLEGIERPAIAAQIPNARGGATTVLDLGANVDCSPEHLFQFAVMGSALVSVLTGSNAPSVGLLNIGEEAIKGNEMIKQAGELLRAAAAAGDLNFFGNVEGDDICAGVVDLIVCDGFVGNVALKTGEGVASMIGSFIKEEFRRNWLTMAMGLMARPVLVAIKSRLDAGQYNGGALLGLRGLVFKSHGSADVRTFGFALERAYDAARHDLLDRVKARVARSAPLLAAPGAATLG